MHQADGVRPPFHSFYEVYQVFLVRMCGVTTNGGDSGTDRIALAIEFNPAVGGTVLLNSAPRCATGLIPNEQHLVLFIAKHRFEVVHHPAPGGHATGRQDDRRATGFGQVVYRLKMLFVVINGVEVVKAEWMAPDS